MNVRWDQSISSFAYEMKKHRHETPGKNVSFLLRGICFDHLFFTIIVFEPTRPMTHNIAKKFDKFVSKLTSKHKEPKSSHGSDPTDYHFHQEDLPSNDDETPTSHTLEHESILQRMKLHLGNVSKKEHSHVPDGIPPSHVIINDLKNSPFKGKEFSHLHSKKKKTLCDDADERRADSLSNIDDNQTGLFIL